MFELDGRVLRSLKSIVCHPGALARAFADNKRASFVNPFRLFMFTTILWFFLFSITFPTPDDQRPNGGGSREESRATLELQTEFNEFSALDEVTITEGMKRLRTLLEGDRLWKFDALVNADHKPRGMFLIHSVANFLYSQPTMPVWLQRVVANVVVDLIESPQFLINEALDNLPLIMFVLLPWYALLLFTFYARKGYRFIHHLVFAIHVHSFSFIVLSIVILTPDSRGPDSNSIWYQIAEFIDACLAIGLFIHTYFAFKNFYGQGYGKTAFKYLSLGVLYSFGLIPSFVLLLALLLSEYLYF